MTYTLDTNIVIKLLRDNPSVWAEYGETARLGGSVVISPFVDYEVRKGFHYKPAPSKERAYDAICARCRLEDMTADVWRKASRIYADLRHAGYTVGDADILIGAFSIVKGYTLVTSNTKDFTRMEGLKLENWA